MKKKIVCAMMCIAMAATSLAGCGSDDGAADGGQYRCSGRRAGG